MDLRNHKTLPLLLATFLILATVLFPPSAQAVERRVALVIGNGDYLNTAKLPNPPNDAGLIAEALKSAGFTLVGGKPLLNGDRSAMERSIREFGNALQGGAIGLFYYSGHGVQVKGSNYLIPVTANLVKESDVKYELVDVGFVLDEMSNAGNRLNIVILDACRNNPFGGRSFRAMSSGLAQVTAPAGTVISYATQPGNVAIDGAGSNSPYTEALAESIRQPGQDVFATFNTVGLKVKQTTGGQQQPWLSTSPIEGQFYFSGTPEIATPVSTPASVDPASVELAFWDTIKSSSDPADFQDYLTRYPTGQFAGLAQRKLASFSKVQKAVATTDPAMAEAPPPLAAPEEVADGPTLLDSWRSGYIRKGGFLQRSR
ncbi:MAG: caspase domain-containing protein [Alphaproteobacteria bacterium]